MKIRCDVCDKAEASVFCCADEAALCDGCDRRVHHANKLASKHTRFSLLHPSFKESPLCDICQERRAFLFCKEDRAILCRECDLPIHKANEHTQSHNRFLLTGVKLSASSSLYPTTSSSTNSCEAKLNSCNRNSSSLHPYQKKPSPVSNEVFSSPSAEITSSTTTAAAAAFNIDDNQFSDSGSMSTSSISEYLETLPGWRVDDFLDPSFAAYTNGFSKTKTGDRFLPLMDQDLENYTNSFSTEDLALWVNQVSCIPESKEVNNRKVSRKWCNDDSFMVPRISPQSLKRSRHFA